ncbi:hypothetical protein KQX54_006465 [Cotesia glomerata]|uniref:Uncharacterized protein n=1 Tax=Cotesia glomerata TaxID=32391 RepID=A0AAV7J634_COTGL|nr:hypothetical protein KQX54_006465 [Cotesia glomerata]
MSKKYDDPRFVLAALNALGCIYVNAKDLQDFMKDLKNYRKKKEVAHKAWKQRVIRKFIAYNRKDMENHMNELRSKQTVHPALGNSVDSDSGDQSSQHPRQFLHVAEVYHRDQSFDVEKSPAGKRIQKSPFCTKEKSLMTTPEVTRENKSIQPNLTDPSSSARSSGKKSSDQTGKILETDSKNQQTIRYDFGIAPEDSDSYRQLPGETKKEDKSHARKDKSSIGKSFNENLFDSNFDISDSYKSLPKPREKTEARDKSQREKSKGSLRQMYNTDFPSSFEQSDSYKTLPKPREITEAREQSQREKSKAPLKKTLDEDFSSCLEQSDSYKTLPKPREKTEAKEQSQREKSKAPLKKTHNEDFPSSLEQSDSYKTLPKPRKKTEAKDQSQREKSKAPVKKTYNEDFPSSFEVSDSYKQLPGAKEKIDLQFKSRGAGRDTITPGMTLDRHSPSNIEASDSYKEIARKPRNQEEDKSREKSQRAETYRIVDQNTSPRRDKSIPTDKKMSATLRGKDKSVKAKPQSDAHENFIESGLNYSDFQQDVLQITGRSSPVDKNLSMNRPRDFQRDTMHGRSRSIEKVPLDQKSSEQFSLKDLRERSHLDFDSSRSAEPSQTANRMETDRNTVARDRAVERSASKLKEVTRLRFDDSDSESDSESNYLEQYEAVRPSEEVGRMDEQQKSQSSAQSTPNFRQRKEINYDSSSKSDSESISQAAARNRKEEIVRTGKTPARSGRFQPDNFVERSHLEF